METVIRDGNKPHYKHGEGTWVDGGAIKAVAAKHKVLMQDYAAMVAEMCERRGVKPISHNQLSTIISSNWCPKRGVAHCIDEVIFELENKEKNNGQ